MEQELMTHIEDLIEQAQQAYYEGNPIMSDAQYDELVRVYGPDVEKNIGPSGDIPHLNPMYSLRKVYPGRGEDIPNTKGYIKTPKLDGAAIETQYTKVNGDLFILSHLVTRGSVETGKELDLIKAKPLNIPTLIKVSTLANKIQITGEVIATKDTENARNMVSGKLNTKDSVEYLKAAEELGLTFVAYSVTKEGMQPLHDTYTEDMKWLSSEKFYSILEAADLISANPTIKTDGIVYRLEDNAAYFELGFTSKHPRGAFAIKEDQEYISSVLREVVWGVGRTGKIVPVAIIDPINIGGAIVSRATLNNPNFIEAMGLYIGCKVKVIRSGEIIPCIIGLDE
jgi:NAD-dependent DNA ligase